MQYLNPTLKLALLALATAAAAPPAWAQWAVSTLDRPTANGTQLWGINDAGQIVGGDSLGGFVYTSGVATALPTLANATALTPFGISNTGVVVGSWVSALDTYTHGFVYQSGVYTTWDLPQANVVFTQIRSISLDGRYFAGYYTLAGGSGKGFVYDTSTLQLQTLEPALGSVILHGGNSAGQTTGSLTGVNPNLGSNGGLLVAPSGSYTLYTSVTGVVGRPSFRGINDSGLVAGWTLNAADSTNTAIVGTLAGGTSFTALTMPGGASAFSEGLNNAGFVIGQYTGADGTSHGFLATPVPELGTPVLWLSGAAGLLLWQRRRAAVKGATGA